MLKFIEVVQKALEYDGKTESCKSSFSLRETYINPDYIVSMKENTVLKQRSLDKPLIEGMDENISFTELAINMRSPGYEKLVDVVGTPTEIIKKHYGC